MMTLDEILASQEFFEAAFNDDKLMSQEGLFDSKTYTNELQAAYKSTEKSGLPEKTRLVLARRDANRALLSQAALNAGLNPLSGSLDTNDTSGMVTVDKNSRKQINKMAKAAANSKKVKTAGKLAAGAAFAATEGNVFKKGYNAVKTYNATKTAAREMATSAGEAMLEAGEDIYSSDSKLKVIEDTGKNAVKSAFDPNSEMGQRIREIASHFVDALPEPIQKVLHKTVDVVNKVGQGVKKILPIVTYAIPLYFLIKDQMENGDYESEVKISEDVQKESDLLGFRLKRHSETLSGIGSDVTGSVEDAHTSSGTDPDMLMSEAEQYLNSSDQANFDQALNQFNVDASQAKAQVTNIDTEVQPGQDLDSLVGNGTDNLTEGDLLTQEYIKQSYNGTMAAMLALSEDNKNTRESISEMLSSVSSNQLEAMMGSLEEIDQSVKDAGEQAALAVKAASGAEQGEVALEEAIQESNDVGNQTQAELASQIQTGFEGLSDELVIANPEPPKRNNMIRDLMGLWAGHNLGAMGTLPKFDLNMFKDIADKDLTIDEYNYKWSQNGHIGQNQAASVTSSSAGASDAEQKARQQYSYLSGSNKLPKSASTADVIAQNLSDNATAAVKTGDNVGQKLTGVFDAGVNALDQFTDKAGWQQFGIVDKAVDKLQEATDKLNTMSGLNQGGTGVIVAPTTTTVEKEYIEHDLASNIMDSVGAGA